MKPKTSRMALEEVRRFARRPSQASHEDIAELAQDLLDAWGRIREERAAANRLIEKMAGSDLEEYAFEIVYLRARLEGAHNAIAILYHVLRDVELRQELPTRQECVEALRYVEEYLPECLPKNTAS